MKLRTSAFAGLLACLLMVAACDQVAHRLGIEDPTQKEAKADAEGRAVGSACRQSGRAIEDCYSIYNWLPKASIFTGWRDMNDYMQSNKLDIVEPKLPPAPGPKKKKVVDDAAGEEKIPEAKADDKPVAETRNATQTEVKKDGDKSAARTAAKH